MDAGWSHPLTTSFAVYEFLAARFAKEVLIYNTLVVQFLAFTRFVLFVSFNAHY